MMMMIVIIMTIWQVVRGVVHEIVDTAMPHLVPAGDV